MQWRLAQVRHIGAKDSDALERAREAESQPRAIRALNMLEAEKGSGVTYSRTEDEKGLKTGVSVKGLLGIFAAVPRSEQILYHDPLEEIIAKTPALYPDHYDPMEGLKIVTAYQMACLDEAAVGGALPRQGVIPAPKLIQ